MPSVLWSAAIPAAFFFLFLFFRSFPLFNAVRENKAD
jgi:hypothetical protein